MNQGAINRNRYFLILSLSTFLCFISPVNWKGFATAITRESESLYTANGNIAKMSITFLILGQDLNL